MAGLEDIIQNIPNYVPDLDSLEGMVDPFAPEGPYVETTLKDVVKTDPFYQAGLINLGNVRPFREDPRLTTSADLKQAEKDLYGYTWGGDPLMYVDQLDYPTKRTGSTVTHEGIHNIFDPSLSGVGAGVLEGTITGSGSATGPRHITNELMTNYLANQIYGDAVEPFTPEVGGVNYATMDRPGQGALGEEGLRELLAKRGDPFLKKMAYRAHKNIEGRGLDNFLYPQITGKPWQTGGGDIWAPKTRKPIPPQTPSTGGGWHPGVGGNGGGGGLGKGVSPTGSDVQGTPFNMGGLARLLYYGGLV